VRITPLGASGVMKTSQLTFLGIVGEFNRYAVYEMEPREGCSDASRYLVEDAEKTDEETGLPAVIRQSASLADALDGLAEPHEIRALLAV